MEKFLTTLKETVNPVTWLQRTTEGLATTHKVGIRYPMPFQIPSACELLPAFIPSEED